ncbi:Protein of unknown function [Bacillus wiedmannii]
MKIMD